jgi:hypothetical protein
MSLVSTDYIFEKNIIRVLRLDNILPCFMSKNKSEKDEKMLN